MQLPGAKVRRLRIDAGGVESWSASAGKGTVIKVSASPSLFASSPDRADMLRSILASACKAAGVEYTESPRLAIRRGNYVAVRTFDGCKNLKGSYVNILDPKLSVVKDPTVAPDKCALYKDVTRQMTGAPKLLYASSKVEKKVETAQSTKLTLTGPVNTKGVARIYTGGKQVLTVEPTDLPVQAHGDTVLATYENMPESVSISIEWKQ
jgi:hypothetical protein